MVDLLTPVVPKGLSAPERQRRRDLGAGRTSTEPKRGAISLGSFIARSFSGGVKGHAAGIPHHRIPLWKLRAKKLPGLTLLASVLKVRVAAPRSQRRSQGGNCRCS